MDDIQEPGPISGPVQQELIIRFDEAEKASDLFQRWDTDRTPPTIWEFFDFFLRSYSILKDSCFQLAAEVDAIRGERGL